MVISVGSDHAGFEQKEALAEYLRRTGHVVLDRGPGSDARVDYPDYARLVGLDVAQGAAERGVLVCGTGIGMAIAANKIDGVRAANAVTPEFAALCRQHNNANVVTLSGRFVGLDENERILDAFLGASFEGGRHSDRVRKISQLEERPARP